MQLSFFAEETIGDTAVAESVAPSISLRNYQTEAVEAILRELAAGVHRQVVSLSTGGGKTILFASLIKHLPCPTLRATQVLVLAHRKELVEQNAEKIGLVNPDLKIGIEMGNQRADPDCDVISATVQTLGREGSDRIKKFDPDNFKSIIVDEVHHCSEDNSTYMSILDYFGVSRKDTDKSLLGFSATVKRSDGKGLAHTYDEITYHKGISEGIDEGWLSPLKALRIDSASDISGVSIRNGQFAQDELEDAINNPDRNDLIYDAWYEHAFATGRKSTLIFCADVNHIYEVCNTFRRNGVDARLIHGNTPRAERTMLVNDFRNGKIPVMVNCAVLTEGTDFPNIDTLIMARPCRSASLYIQCVGRGTRLPPGFDNMSDVTGDNKRDCLVLDIMDVCGSHSLITTPVLFDLRQDFDAEGEEIQEVARSVKKLAVQNASAELGKTLAEAKKIVAEEIDLLSLRDADDEYSDMTNLMWRQVNNKQVFRSDIPGTNGKTDGFIKIEQDAVGHWEVKYIDPTGVDPVVRKRNTIELAFQAADSWIENDFNDRLPLMQKNMSWHSQPMTDGQRNFMKKLRVPYTDAMTKIDASKAINDALLRRKSKPKKRKPKIDQVTVGKL